jgi:cold shock CspA family protein
MTATETEKKTGTCKWFNAKKGFGFIKRDDGTEDIFVHQTGIHAEGFRSLLEDEVVEFNLTQDEQGRLKAIDVTGPEGAFVKGAPKPGSRRNRGRNQRRRRKREQEDENSAPAEEENTGEEGAEEKEEEEDQNTVEETNEETQVENTAETSTTPAEEN